MQNLTVGTKVTIANDNWDDVGKTGTVTAINGFSVIVESEDGVTMTLSKDQVRPQTFLSEGQ